MSENMSWEAQCYEAARVFGKQCAQLAKSNPHEHPSPLSDLINTLMTELWDNNFSQTEIRSAFEAAIEDMPRYAAGLERRDQGRY